MSDIHSAGMKGIRYSNTDLEMTNPERNHKRYVILQTLFTCEITIAFLNMPIVSTKISLLSRHYINMINHTHDGNSLAQKPHAAKQI